MNNWYNSLPKNTQEYLKTAAIWTDTDLIKYALIAFVVGLITGWLTWAI